jgi:MFS family permease
VSAVDVRWILAAQAGRAFGYGLAAVLLGATLAGSGLTATQVGLVLAAVVAGTVGASLVVGVLADQRGRRRTYLALYAALGVTGVVYAFTSRWPVLTAAALLGCCPPKSSSPVRSPPSNRPCSPPPLMPSRW